MFVGRLNDDIKNEKVIWDLIDNGKVTLYELEHSYNFEDLNRYLAVINCNSDYKNFIQQRQNNKTQSKSKRAGQA